MYGPDGHEMAGVTFRAKVKSDTMDAEAQPFATEKQPLKDTEML